MGRWLEISVAASRKKATPICQPRRSRLLIAVFCGLALPTLHGCVYSFTNSHVVRPEGIESVAVEAVYDTSREVLPHELLWSELQQAFAADGHLRLVPQAHADALVRAHLRQAAVTAIGSNTLNGPTRDPDPFDGDVPPGPSEFKPLTQAGEFRDKARVSYNVDVEVWSLRTRTLLLRRTYNLGADFQAVHTGAFTTRANDYLRYDEATDAKFKLLAQQISRSVVQDLLVR